MVIKKLLIIGGVLIMLGVGFIMFLNNQSADNFLPTATMSEDEIQTVYGPLVPLYFGRVQMRASIADTEAERQQGLSGTPSLPIGIVKLFVFDEPIVAPFWMKDMNYPIDILWLDADKKIIYVAPNLTPETYPTTFGPAEPSLYVIETPAGQAAREGMKVGSSFVW